MLEDHQRAAMMTNEGNVTWHQFVRSRFIGQRSNRSDTFLTVDIQGVSLQSSSHAVLQGLLEYSADSSLPVVFEFVGTLDLDSREVLIHSGQEDNPERSYEGRFSENGRVLELRMRTPGKSRSKPLHLINETTIRELFGPV